MGLFSSAVKVITNPIGSGVKAAGEKLGVSKKATDAAALGASPTGFISDKVLGGILNGGDNATPTSFNPSLAATPADLADVRGDVGKIREFRDTGITGPRESTKLEIEALGTSRDKALSDLQAGQGGRFDTLAQQLLLGGADEGSRERLSRSIGRQGETEAQNIRGRFGELESGLRAGDLAGQESLKDKALFGLPNLSILPANLQAQINLKNAAMSTTAAAANQRAAALAKSQKGGALGSLAGGIAGAYFGGPAGAAVGSQVGGSIGQGGLFS